jgi:aminopeptidase N
MRDAAPTAPQPVLLRDYRPVPVTVTHVDLHVRLDPQATRVRARLACERRGEGPMVLDGEGLKMVSLAMDGAPLSLDAYDLTPTALRLTGPLPDRFELQTECEIAPARNTALEGLYMSNGMYCTQCEAEGFRRITWMLDRPDVMATYAVEIEGDLPVRLSNGNELGPGRWHDPWPKPTYLFALVAGNLHATSSRFTTMEGRDVALNIWVRQGDEGRTGYAMDALKRSMAWDERAYGRAYDLDVFNVVAVDDFNMGAMENKGLNVFNSRYVLASPDTATDADYANIERIVAHEYFHNWTGNRVTCRDWFQLCLKEGLTVFRDQEFMADMRSGPVQRIGDVITLRARQFREDAGPLAHPVRPESFVEINNFYTATVYEKGAEVIRMLRTLVGPAAYDKALTLYFDRHDGDAATIEDWLKVFEDVTGRDLSAFMRWYSQAGTPRVTFTSGIKNGHYVIDLKQDTAPTPGQDDKAPQVIPIRYGLLDHLGHEVVPDNVVVMEGETARIAFPVSELGTDAPVPSLLRGFSAPVILAGDLTDAQRLILLAHDTDPFNRWEAARALTKGRLLAHVADGAAFDAGWLDAMAMLARDSLADPAFRALALSMPSEDDLAQSLHENGAVPDPDAIHAARHAAQDALARHLAQDIPVLRAGCATPGPYDPRAEDAGKRALSLRLLRLLTYLDGGAVARALYGAADNMTEGFAAFAILLEIGDPDVAGRFEEEWRHDRLVMDKWFMAQVAHAAPERAVDVADGLTRHADFDPGNPNRFRSVMGGLLANPAAFHAADGRGYAFVADWLLRIDGANPQTAARLSTGFETWRRYDADRQGLIREQLARIAGHDGLSRDLGEMVQRMLG